MWDFEHPPRAATSPHTTRSTTPSPRSALTSSSPPAPTSGSSPSHLSRPISLSSQAAPSPRSTKYAPSSSSFAAKHPITVVALSQSAPSPPTRPRAARSPMPIFSSANSSTSSPPSSPAQPIPSPCSSAPTPPSSSATPHSSPSTSVAQLEEAIGQGPYFHWFDLAHEWRTRTSLPWVAAVWAVRPESLSIATPHSRATHRRPRPSPAITASSTSKTSSTSGRPASPLLPDTIRHYLIHNIHYILDSDCIRTIELFRQYAAEIGILRTSPESSLSLRIQNLQ